MTQRNLIESFGDEKISAELPSMLFSVCDDSGGFHRRPCRPGSRAPAPSFVHGLDAARWVSAGLAVSSILLTLAFLPLAGNGRQGRED